VKFGLKEGLSVSQAAMASHENLRFLHCDTRIPASALKIFHVIMESIVGMFTGPVKILTNYAILANQASLAHGHAIVPLFASCFMHWIMITVV